MVNEVVEKYQPDMIWFDFELGTSITPEYQRQMFAAYYNWAEQHGRRRPSRTSSARSTGTRAFSTSSAAAKTGSRPIPG